MYHAKNNLNKIKLTFITTSKNKKLNISFIKIEPFK